jgi:hypothetical protein
MDQDSVKLGLLIETAERHQKLAAAAITTLSEQTQGLEAMVRDQIRRAVVEEMKTVRAETQSAVEALQSVKRAANARVTLWTLGLTAISVGVALFVAWCVLPTPRLKSRRYAPNAISSRATLQSSINAVRGRICGGAGRGTSAFGWT